MTRKNPAPGEQACRIKTATTVADLVARFVRRTGFKVHRTFGNVIAAKITELSGDSVALDETEEVLVALRRKKVIAGRRLVDLLGRHQRERRG